MPGDGTEPPVQPTPLARVRAGRESGRLGSRGGRSDLSRLPAGRLTGNVGLVVHASYPLAEYGEGGIIEDKGVRKEERE
jgi:hypothetical protein